MICAAVSAAAARLPAAAGPEGNARPAAAPRVIVLGSICGGTGGGAILDVAYAVRGELKRQGLSDDDVHGVLLHSTPRGNAERDKSLANAYALLSELNHYSRPGSHFPGEAALGIPPFHGDNATFRRTHVLDLGRGLGGREWDLAVEKAVEFLFASGFTSAREMLDCGQKSDGPSEGDGHVAPFVVVLGCPRVRGRHDAARFADRPPHLRRRRASLARRSSRDARGGRDRRPDRVDDGLRRAPLLTVREG